MATVSRLKYLYKQAVSAIAEKRWPSEAHLSNYRSAVYAEIEHLYNANFALAEKTRGEDEKRLKALYGIAKEILRKEGLKLMIFWLMVSAIFGRIEGPWQN